MKYLVCLFLIFNICIGTDIYAQKTEKTDSVINKIESLLKLSEQVRRKSPDKSVTYARRALEK